MKQLFSRILLLLLTTTLFVQSVTAEAMSKGERFKAVCNFATLSGASLTALTGYFLHKNIQAQRIDRAVIKEQALERLKKAPLSQEEIIDLSSQQSGRHHRYRPFSESHSISAALTEAILIVTTEVLINGVLSSKPKLRPLDNISGFPLPPDELEACANEMVEEYFLKKKETATSLGLLCAATVALTSLGIYSGFLKEKPPVEPAQNTIPYSNRQQVNWFPQPQPKPEPRPSTPEQVTALFHDRPEEEQAHLDNQLKTFQKLFRTRRAQTDGEALKVRETLRDALKEKHAAIQSKMIRRFVTQQGGTTADWGPLINYGNTPQKIRAFFRGTLLSSSPFGNVDDPYKVDLNCLGRLYEHNGSCHDEIAILKQDPSLEAQRLSAIFVAERVKTSKTIHEIRELEAEFNELFIEHLVSERHLAKPFMDTWPKKERYLQLGRELPQKRREAIAYLDAWEKTLASEHPELAVLAAKTSLRVKIQNLEKMRGRKHFDQADLESEIAECQKELDALNAPASEPKPAPTTPKPTPEAELPAEVASAPEPAHPKNPAPATQDEGHVPSADTPKVPPVVNPQPPVIPVVRKPMKPKPIDALNTPVSEPKPAPTTPKPTPEAELPAEVASAPEPAHPKNPAPATQDEGHVPSADTPKVPPVVNPQPPVIPVVRKPMRPKAIPVQYTFAPPPLPTPSVDDARPNAAY